MTRCPCPPILDLIFPDFQIQYSTNVTRLTAYPQQISWIPHLAAAPYQDHCSYTTNYENHPSFQPEVVRTPEKKKAARKPTVRRKSKEYSDKRKCGCKNLLPKDDETKIFSQPFPKLCCGKDTGIESADIPGIEEFLNLDLRPTTLPESPHKLTKNYRKKHNISHDKNDMFQVMLQSLISSVQDCIHPRTQKRKYKKRKSSNEICKPTKSKEEGEVIYDSDLNISLELLNEYRKRKDLTPRMTAILRHYRLKYRRALRSACVAQSRQYKGRSTNLTTRCNTGGRCSNKWQQIQKYVLDETVVQKLRENEQTQKLIRVLCSTPQRTLRSTEAEFNISNDDHAKDNEKSTFFQGQLDPNINDTKPTPQGYILDEDNFVCPDIEATIGNSNNCAWWL
uniref:uncharacterized protein LOC100175489 isoform X2 n=1 Tax=Ciona intestinalis TaxID=7719 RepID=UPI000EF54502|nr:uncharacterized protein LOC100175489 isoform X2 [Ciona intestinalis]|eukprot:XP_026695685.1 uncharacterized protein LOC100175489 isoform X2 [Ciona intestinalis]